MQVSLQGGEPGGECIQVTNGRCPAQMVTAVNKEEFTSDYILKKIKISNIQPLKKL